MDWQDDKKIDMQLQSFLTLSLTLFLLGLSGIILNRRNIIITLMSIELMLLAVNLNFIIYSVFLDDLFGQLFALFVLTVAASESAIGLAILVVYFRVRGSIAMDTIRLMSGLSIPMDTIRLFFLGAQLIWLERMADNYEVGGSNPSAPKRVINSVEE